MKELKSLLIDDNKLSENDSPDDEYSRERPTIAKHILVFMFILWDQKYNPMKRVVACCSVDKSRGEELCN